MTKAGAILPPANMLMREPEKKTAWKKKCTVTSTLAATEVAAYLNSEHAFW